MRGRHRSAVLDHDEGHRLHGHRDPGGDLHHGGRNRVHPAADGRGPGLRDDRRVARPGRVAEHPGGRGQLRGAVGGVLRGSGQGEHEPALLGDEAGLQRVGRHHDGVAFTIKNTSTQTITWSLALDLSARPTFPAINPKSFAGIKFDSSWNAYADDACASLPVVLLKGKEPSDQDELAPGQSRQYSFQVSSQSTTGWWNCTLP